MVNSNLMVKILKFKLNGKFKPKGLFFFFFFFLKKKNFKPNGKFKPKGHIFLTLNPTINSNLKVILPKGVLLWLITR